MSMATLSQRNKRTTLLDTREALLARQSGSALTHLLQRRGSANATQDAPPASYHLSGSEGAPYLPLPDTALPYIARLLEEMGKGKPVIVLSADRELTPNQAAEYLGMSRPFLLRLLDSGKIPQRYVGTHRRVKLQAILAFEREKERQVQVMGELVQQAQELDMGY